MTDIDQEIVDGYRAALRGEPRDETASVFWRFGWTNGRDDRRRRPRDTAQGIRDELADLIAHSGECRGVDG